MREEDALVFYIVIIINRTGIGVCGTYRPERVAGGITGTSHLASCNSEQHAESSLTFPMDRNTIG
jgi:hypothetical protein